MISRERIEKTGIDSLPEDTGQRCHRYCASASETGGTAVHRKSCTGRQGAPRKDRVPVHKRQLFAVKTDPEIGPGIIRIGFIVGADIWHQEKPCPAVKR